MYKLYVPCEIMMGHRDITDKAIAAQLPTKQADCEKGGYVLSACRWVGR